MGKISKPRLLLARYLWSSLGDVCVNDLDEIATDWHIFPAGTHRECIWLWFEEEFEGLSVAEDLMYGRKNEGRSIIKQ